MKITRNASQPFKKGPAEYFTGSVRIDQPFQGSAPARVGGAPAPPGTLIHLVRH